ncbi:MAG: flavodoxin-dependent (E)-4-hydroxy-3-methylbut-2-enyl-diphosphate synthase [Oscillospiraceae bacterium]|jgi:(E)-4-hydroxy-3-methylbut-2-enyl-diphosphate synthase|nr:flavodoxin-dependent (E)-4-hydroxy-3-methylbut-2-enyl-diphosphate synthase [Oscillospiraceae bacterium]
MSKQISVGAVKIGGGAPISIQSMTNTDTSDVKATSEQINALAAAGCDIVRVAVPDRKAAEATAEIKKLVSVPIVADIHFNYKLALICVENGVDKIRINPGNIGGADNVRAVVDACKSRGIPIRIGVNAGSLEKDILAKWGKICAEALAESAEGHARLLEDAGFEDICVSMKGSDVPSTVQAYEIFRSKRDYPLHLGVTHVGGGTGAAVKAAVGIGSLLLKGIGDTIRVSMMGEPTQEVVIAREILYAVGLRRPELEIISCPTCGRCKVDLEEYVERTKTALNNVKSDSPLRVAVMGCEVNGPGEGKDCDFGLACGPKNGILFAGGQTVKKVPVESGVDELCALIEGAIK